MKFRFLTKIKWLKFAINFTLIDQIVYEIIINQFTPIQVVAILTSFCVFYYLSLIYYRFTDLPKKNFKYVEKGI